MKKQYLSLIGLLLGISVLSGCTKVQEKKEKIITLEVYGWTDEQEYMDRVAESYMGTHENIVIHMNYVPSDLFEEQMLLLGKQEKQADCILAPYPSVGMVLKENGILSNIKEYIEKMEKRDYPTWYNGDSVCENYMLPYRMSKWMVYYNKTLFDEHGVAYPKEEWTWEDYRETAKKLTTQRGGKKTWGSLNFGASSGWWITPARSAGKVNPMKDGVLEQFKKAAKWNYDLAYKDLAQIPYTDVTGNSASNYDALFLEGNIGMYYCGDWSVQSLNSQIAEKGLDFVYDIAPLPKWKGEKGYTYSNAAVISMAAGTDYPEETFEFMQYVSGQEGAAVLAKNHILPALNNEKLCQIYCHSVDMPEHTEYFFDNKELVTMPSDPLYNDAMSIVQQEVKKYLLKEQSLNQSFQKIKENTKELEVENP